MCTWFGIQNTIVAALGKGSATKKTAALEFYFNLLEQTDTHLKALYVHPVNKTPESRTTKGSKTGAGTKRARSTSSSEGSGRSGDIGTDDDNEDENALTRGKVDKRLLAWLWREEPDSFASKSVLEKN
ncbi:hypothetical protein K435DRAFT_796928 [Dendrothele bispora CBS 962.96]|uniref:Uncharacterized protein n=1 Tax=Dendrothele bispora (strain CBS 962.96) TaxID=1314807 RepID=A0A4S8M4A5_DENBC|nr:hypothetical protein K435DRAFT_796928 [Dendrothele bispora CBS 962.96]